MAGNTTTGTSRKEAIRSAASRLFQARGFARTTVRDIAAEAEVDPALVIRHFGTKQLLFLETAHLTLDEEPLLDVPLEALGERLVDFLLDVEEPARGILLALVRGSDDPVIAKRLRATHDETFITPLRQRLTGPDAELRSRLAGALVGGLLYAAWVVRDDELLATDRSSLVVRYGALLQELLTPSS